MTDKTTAHGHRKRLRERFIKTELKGFHDYEIIELLLTYSIPVKDVKPIAKKLINVFGSVSEILDAEFKDLVKIHGLSDYSAVLVKLVKEIKTEYKIDKLKSMNSVSSSSDAYDFAFEKLAGCKDEKFMAIYMNSKNRIIDYEITSEGTVTQARVYPRKIIKEALAVNAAALIIVHKHPSGEVGPSKQDIELTKSLRDVCETMDIRLLDHLIVGKTGYQSCM
ncbi:MAG: DNA repair protein RadC [Victivallales bacterium]|nr:DNA repair protein RadC [Victivallales bacterium]